MAGTTISLTVPCTLLVVAMLCGSGVSFLDDTKKLVYKLNLTLEPKLVSRARSENVRLRCEPASSQTVQLERFSIIRILKQDPSDSTGNTWVSIIQKKNVEVKNAVLEYVWPVATSDTFGVYHCDAIGFTADLSIVSANTPDIVIKMGGVTANDLLDVLLTTKARLQDKVNNNTMEISEINDQLEDLAEQERNRSRVIDDRLATSERARDSVMHRLLFPEIPWPSGRYALLQPATGCPLDLRFYAGNTGYFTMHGESSQGHSKTFANPETHLAKPVVNTSGSDIFVTLRFCTSNTIANSIPWPKGEYCIHSVDNSCPTGFSRGSIAVDTEDTNNKDAKGGNHPYYAPSDLRFCCIKSGAYSSPMVLPTETPFYLYRYQSPCQVIAGMKVQLDYFEIGVESRSNAASGACPYSIFKTKSRRFELCYYSKE
ncbi:hypothetical protein RRG08_058609 [Elysia crispata]|uniref:Apextrin C-terminal domain-containing protein n=1 Tax=Elysia crispata TaxID=231223 RepID=A0AAE0Z1M7_9GAST|nr:hypothetical protein RRG08_058609 [Elysia crispata]